MASFKSRFFLAILLILILVVASISIYKVLWSSPKDLCNKEAIKERIVSLSEVYSEAEKNKITEAVYQLNGCV